MGRISVATSFGIAQASRSRTRYLKRPRATTADRPCGDDFIFHCGHSKPASTASWPVLPSQNMQYSLRVSSAPAAPQNAPGQERQSQLPRCHFGLGKCLNYRRVTREHPFSPHNGFQSRGLGKDPDWSACKYRGQMSGRRREHNRCANA